MSALVSTVSKVLKDRYLGPLQRQLNDEILIFQLLELDSKAIDLDGNQAVVPLHKGRSTGIGARIEGDTLPSAGYQVFEKAVYDLKYLYGRAQFSGQAIQKTKTDAGAFIRVMTEELDRLREDLALDLARQVYGDGTGVIATIPTGSVGANATQTISSAEPVDKGFLYPNMRVDVGTVANPVATADSAVISSVSGTSVVFTAAIDTADGDKIFREDNCDASSVCHEVTGLQALIGATGTVGGINSASAGNEFWQSTADSSGTWSLDNLILVANKAKAKGAKMGNQDLIVTDGLARRLFASADFKDNVRFVGENEFKHGFTGLKFAAGGAMVNLVADRLAPWGKAHFIDKAAMSVYSPGNWSFLDRDGLTIRWVSDKDAFQAVLFRYMNLGVKRRNTHAVMTGLTDTGY